MKRLFLSLVVALGCSSVIAQPGGIGPSSGVTVGGLSSNTVYNMIITYGGGGGGVTAADVTNIVNAIGGPTNGLTTNQVVGLLRTTNTVPRVLISDLTPQDPFRWIDATNGVTAYPAWVSTRIVGSLTPGIHFYNITNGADEFSIDVQHDHAAAGKSEARMIARWDMAIVPGYNSRVQLGASTDNWGNSIDVQYGNRMGWSHLFNLWGNTNSNIGALSMQGRRISTSTNLNELWIWASEPTWNSYPTPGFSATGPQIAKLAIGGTYFYSDLWTPRTIVTNRQLIGAGPMFYTTAGGLELSSGYSDGFMVGADLSSATRTTGASKYFWMTMTPKTHGNPRLNIQSVANDSSSTATLYIGGGSGSATAPMNSVKIYAGSDSTTLGTGVLSVNVTPGLVTVSNLTADGVITGNGSGLTNLPTATLLGWTTNSAAASAISNANTIALPAGSKTVVAIAKTGSLNNGFYFTGGGGFGYSAGGETALYLDSSASGLAVYPTWPIGWGSSQADSAIDAYFTRLSAGNINVNTNLLTKGSVTATNGFAVPITQEYSTNSTANAAGSIFGLDPNVPSATILQTNSMQFTNTLSVIPAGTAKTLSRTIIGSGNAFSVNPQWHGMGSYSTNGGTLANGTHYKFSLEINYVVSSNAYYWAIVPCNN